MKKFISYRFILIATLTYIPHTILWFFWHNNIFHKLYYETGSLVISSMNLQNVWLMNFANALLIYGFVYFYFRAVKDGTKLINAVLWGIYYCLSAIGFYSFLNFGMVLSWNTGILVHDLFFAVIGGAFAGFLVHFLYGKIAGRNNVSSINP